jgi:hypothetical protein
MRRGFLMTENQLNRLEKLISISNKDTERGFRTWNTIGTECYGKYFLGEYTGKMFYIKQKFFVIGFVPLIPICYFLTYETNDETYIIGELKHHEIKDIIGDTSGLVKSGYLDGIFQGFLMLLFFVIVLGILVFIRESF